MLFHPTAATAITATKLWHSYTHPAPPSLVTPNNNSCSQMGAPHATQATKTRAGSRPCPCPPHRTPRASRAAFVRRSHFPSAICTTQPKGGVPCMSPQNARSQSSAHPTRARHTRPLLPSAAVPRALASGAAFHFPPTPSCQQACLPRPCPRPLSPVKLASPAQDISPLLAVGSKLATPRRWQLLARQSK